MQHDPTRASKAILISVYHHYANFDVDSELSSLFVLSILPRISHINLTVNINAECIWNRWKRAAMAQYFTNTSRFTFVQRLFIPKTGRKQQKPFHLSISKFENTSDLLIEIHPLPPRNLEGKGLFPYRGRGVAVILIWRPLVNDPFEVITCAASRFPPPIRVYACVRGPRFLSLPPRQTRSFARCSQSVRFLKGIATLANYDEDEEDEDEDDESRVTWWRACAADRRAACRVAARRPMVGVRNVLVSLEERRERDSVSAASPPWPEVASCCSSFTFTHAFSRAPIFSFEWFFVGDFCASLLGMLWSNLSSEWEELWFRRRGGRGKFVTRVVRFGCWWCERMKLDGV